MIIGCILSPKSPLTILSMQISDGLILFTPIDLFTNAWNNLSFSQNSLLNKKLNSSSSLSIQVIPPSLFQHTVKHPSLSILTNWLRSLSLDQMITLVP